MQAPSMNKAGSDHCARYGLRRVPGFVALATAHYFYVHCGSGSSYIPQPAGLCRGVFIRCADELLIKKKKVYTRQFESTVSLIH